MPLSPDATARYSRHLLLPEIGRDGQERLAASSVVCIGAGGLGSVSLLYLAAAGIGRITIIDPDVVDVSNLQRQVIHGTRDVGRRKVDSAAERLRDLNPLIDIRTHAVGLSAANALELLSGHDVIVDGTDNFPTRFLVDDASVRLGVPNVYGSVFRFEGQASVFNYRGGPTYRDLFPEPPPAGSVPSCGEAGVLGVLPGLIGTIQATEAIKVLLGRDDTLSGRLLLYDARAMRFHELALQRDPNLQRPAELRDDLGRGDLPPLPAVALSPAEAAARLRAGWSAWVVDVRRREEAEVSPFRAAHALHPHDQLPDDLPRDRDLLLVCRSGARSALAARTLAERGFHRLFHVDGGLLAWAALDPSDG